MEDRLEESTGFGVTEDMVSVGGTGNWENNAKLCKRKPGFGGGTKAMGSTGGTIETGRRLSHF